MNYLVVGMNHKTAPLKIREQMALDDAKGREALAYLKTDPAVKEVCVLSTCHRVELYGATEDLARVQGLFLNFFKSFFPSAEVSHEHLYCKQDREVVSHLFSVTASLDSMVAGENQITGQVKKAYHLASECAVMGAALNQLFHRAFYTAKRVRTETGIGLGNVSVGSAAVMLAAKIYETLNDKTVMLMGAGKMGGLVVRTLQNQSVKKIFVVNRTLSKAEDLVTEGLGQAVSYDAFFPLLRETDIVVTSLVGLIPELNPRSVTPLMQDRGERPLLVIDLGVPRNVAEDVGKIDDVYLYNIDDLQGIAREGQLERQKHLDQAQRIVEAEVQFFCENILDNETLPTIANLGQRFEEIRKKEFEKALAKMPHLADTDVKNIEKLTQAIVNRVLHAPILSLKNKAEMAGPGVVSVIRRIFRLDDEG